mmetsp:Transcript_82066/g.145463  ORF Transcript_82066/g.145463 Transcript_82066/m.145463 type:complete len:96 (+) Transcript_82066:240-527(+)
MQNSTSWRRSAARSCTPRDVGQAGPAGHAEPAVEGDGDTAGHPDDRLVSADAEDSPADSLPLPALLVELLAQLGAAVLPAVLQPAWSSPLLVLDF